LVIHRKLKELIKPGGVIVEIGAHIGTDTTKLHNNLKPVVLYAFEPDPRNYSKLEDLNLENVEICDVFIGNKDETVLVWWSYGETPNGREHTDSNSLMKPKDNAPWVKFRKGVSCCYTLDSIYFLKKIKIELIWMDVQGAEILIIEGGRSVLSRTKYLYTECQEGRYEGQFGLDKILAALPNWKLVERFGDNALLRNEYYND